MSGSLLRLWLMVAGVVLGAVAGAAGSFGTGYPMRLVAVVLVLPVGLVVLRRRPITILLALFLFGLGCGAVSAGSRAGGGETLRALAAQVRHCQVRGTILEDAGGLGTLARIARLECDSDVLVEPGSVILDTDAPAGSGFSATGWLVPLATDRFDVARKRAGADAEFAVDHISLVRPTGPLAIAAALRDGLRVAGGYISPPEAGLIRGLSIGDTDGVAQPTVEDFRRSGLSHLLAVSGSNVAIVLGGIAALAAGVSFRLRMIIGTATLLLFVLVVGPDASVLRAAAMGGVGLLALVSGRQSEPMHALGVALMVIVLLRPQIVFAVGLHLSLAATSGIILWAARVEERLSLLPRVVRLPLAVTLSAQLAVLPLLIAVFGQASMVAPLANLLAAVAVAPATVLGLIAAVAGALHPWSGGLVMRAAEPVAAWILLVARSSAEPAWAVLDVPFWAGAVVAVPVCLAAGWSLRCYGRPISLDR